MDVPDLRSIESAVRNDFDELLSSFITEGTDSYILRGFQINTVGAIGSSANALQLLVANSSVFHPNSTHSGTFYQIPASEQNQTISSITNPKVQGSFVPSSLNYIGFEFDRKVDNTTLGTRYFWVPGQQTEISKVVPLAEILNYKVVLSATGFSSNVLPLAVVETDAANNVLSIEDRRPLLFRLGSSGNTTPNPSYEYPWASRLENPNKTTSAASPFTGGDKQIANLKEWMDAVMTEFKSIKGTPNWYSENVGGSLVNARQDIANTLITGDGAMAHSAVTAGQLNWSGDLFLTLIGSRLSYKVLANPSSNYIQLQDDQVAYIKFKRDQVIIPNLVLTNGSPTVTSVGSVSWTSDVQAGDYIKVASELDTKYYQIASVDSTFQVTLIENYADTSTGIGGINCKYAWGTFQAVNTPSTDRHVKVVDRKDVPFDEDVYWLALRADNGGSMPRLYVRQGGGIGELEQGEETEISDSTPLAILNYTGMASESDSTPDYTNAITTGAAEITLFSFPPANSINTGEHHTLNSALDAVEYYVWFNKNGGGGNPLIAGKIGIEVAISTGQPATSVASAWAAAVSAIPAFSVTNNMNGTVEVENNSIGNTTNAANVNVSGAFSITILQEGAGSPNLALIDGENLTQGLKRLDNFIQSVLSNISDTNYEEHYEVVSGAPSNDDEIQGPILAGTNVTIPLDSRNSNSQAQYTVGSGELGIYLNGVKLISGVDFTEVGLPNDLSTEVQFSFDLIISDNLIFKLEPSAVSGGGGGGGGGGVYTGSNLGSASNGDVFKAVVSNDFQFRRLEAGPNVSLTQTSDKVIITSSAGVAPLNVLNTNIDATLTNTNDVVISDTSGADVTLTLPAVGSAVGKIFYFKKAHAANNLFVQSVFGQLLDGVDITASPLALTFAYESVTITSDGTAWYIL
jgi:hypothetical protein